MDGRRLGSMDLDMVDVDLSVNVVASAVSPPIVESLMKTRMETFEARFIILIAFFVAIGVIAVAVTVAVAIAIAVVDAVIIVVLVLVVIVILVIDIPSVMILSKR